MATPSEPTQKQGTIYIVDDEEALRRSLSRLVEREGWTPRPCDSGVTLLGAIDDAHPACIVLDLAMPGMDGLEVQQELIRRGIDTPVIFLSGEGTISIATKALLRGAMDFLVKPVEPALLLERVQSALREDMIRTARASERRRFDSLTERELEVCERLHRGLASKQIAGELSISVRTVEHHRERILTKTGATNTAEVVSLYARTRASSPRSEQ